MKLKTREEKKKIQCAPKGKNYIFMCITPASENLYASETTKCP